MNKIFNKTNIQNFFYSFLGLVVYFFINYIFTYIAVSLKDMGKLNNSVYNVLLLINELVLVLVLVIIFRKRLKKDFIDFDKNYNKYLNIGFKSWFVGLMVMLVSNYFIHSFFISNQPYNQQAVELVLFKLPLYSTISMIVTGPFVEEIVFRLSFHEFLKNKKLFYFLTILIFASVHVLNGIGSPIELLYFIPYGALACSFTYTLDKTNNIFTTTIIHTFHNLIAISILGITGLIGV